MFPFVIIALLVSLGIYHSGPESVVRDRAPVAHERAVAQAQAFDLFAQAAYAYAANHPSAEGELDAALIMASPTTAPAHRHLALPEGWKVVIDTEGVVTLCAQLDAQIAARTQHRAQSC